MTNEPCVYILANKHLGHLYIDATDNLLKRTWEHKHNIGSRYTSRLKIHNLVYFELTGSMLFAQKRKRQIARLSRHQRIELINTSNPDWSDLYLGILHA